MCCEAIPSGGGALPETMHDVVDAEEPTKMLAKWSGSRENTAPAAEGARNAQEDGGSSEGENECGMC